MAPDQSLFSLLTPNLEFLIIQSLAVILAAILLRGLTITSIFGPLITVLGISWVNSFYWDSQLFFGIPENFTLNTIGLVFCNSIILWIIVKVAPGIEIDGIWTAIKASLILTITSYVVNTYFNDVNWNAVFLAITGILENLRDYFMANNNGK